MKHIEYINKEVLKLALNDKAFANVIIQEDEDNICITTDSILLVVVPKSLIFLDLEKVPHKTFSSFKDCKETDALEDVKILEIHGKTTVFLLQNERTNESIRIDSKYMNLFPDCKFRGTTSKSPVYIYDDNDNWLGLVMPFRIS